MVGQAPLPERPAHSGRGTNDATRSRPEDGDPRVALLVARLAERLRPVCAGWDEAHFQALVHQIARRRVRWGDADRDAAYRDAAYRDGAYGYGAYGYGADRGE